MNPQHVSQRQFWPKHIEVLRKQIREKAPSEALHLHTSLQKFCSCRFAIYCNNATMTLSTTTIRTCEVVCVGHDAISLLPGLGQLPLAMLRLVVRVEVRHA
jgi:hypothetical protein